MCGIAGWIDWERDLSHENKTLASMSETLRQRGPDAKGEWFSPRAALAHRRLIVIDPESGAQPMVHQEDGRKIVITFNGEIYNYRELRTELTQLGHQFRTHSDTEVLLQAYAQWGVDCVRHLNGIFAFGIWDEPRQRLLLARDHLGVKPLFYATRGSAVLFGSEIKALLAHPLVAPEVAADGLAQVFSFMPFHVPGFAIFNNVHEVKAGHCIIFERGKIQDEAYWALRSAPHTDDLATSVERIRSLLDDTVRHQLVADVPVVTMLSGGLDSSGITALAARAFREQGKGLSSYSVDFVDASKYFVPNEMHLSEDTPWAKRVSAHAQTKQHMVIVDSQELVDNILAPLRARDAPGIGQMETSLYLLFKAMKRDATVALSGESADELFGGYPWFFRPESVAADTFPWLAMMRSMWHVEGRSLLSPELAEMVNPEAYVARAYRDAIAEVPRLKGEDADDARRRELFYLNMTRWLPVLLDRKDRVSMAAGFEVRVPFCDYRLVDYVWNIPWSMKNVDDIEKGILRRAFSNVLPQDVLYRRKSPYPATQHPTYAKGVRALAQAIVDDPNAAIRPFLRMDKVREIVAEKDDTARFQNPIGFLERVIQIDAWLKEYKIRVV